MAEFLTTSAIAHQIEEVILKAKSRLVLVSPYLQLPRTLFERLKDADQRGVKTTLIYGKNKLRSEQQGLLAQLGRLELRFCKNLHAKCYYNETSMVITSMNLIEFSEKHNREMGVLLDRRRDADVFQAAVDEVTSILAAVGGEDAGREEEAVGHTYQRRARPKPMVAEKRRSSAGGTVTKAVRSRARSVSTSGHCIRCGRPVAHKTERPLCADCYKVWADHGDRGFPEHYCHTCGKRRKTTFARPECRKCWAPS